MNYLVRTCDALLFDDSVWRVWTAVLGLSSPLPAPWSSFWASWTWARAEAHPQLPWLWTEAFNWNLSRTHSTFDSPSCENRVSPSLLFYQSLSTPKMRETKVVQNCESGRCSFFISSWLTMITIIATSDGHRPYENTTIITKISDTSFRLFSPHWLFRANRKVFLLCLGKLAKRRVCSRSDNAPLRVCVLCDDSCRPSLSWLCSCWLTFEMDLTPHLLSVHDPPQTEC